MTYLDQLKEQLEGREITNIRELTTEEQEAHFFHPCGRGELPIVIELDNNEAIIPKRDAEGNGPGWISVVMAD